MEVGGPFWNHEAAEVQSAATASRGPFKDDVILRSGAHIAVCNKRRCAPLRKREARSWQDRLFRVRLLGEDVEIITEQSAGDGRLCHMEAEL